MCQAVVNPCLHCQETKDESGRPLTWRRRGLCSHCYRSRRIRAKYRAVLRGLGAAHLDFGGEPDLPEEATEARPGSEEKILAMVKRVERLESPFHGDDAADVSDEAEARVRTAVERLARKLAGGLAGVPRVCRAVSSG